MQDYLYDLDNNDIIIEENEEHGEKTYYFKGTYAIANKKNLNKRVYPMDVMYEAYQVIKEDMKKGNVLTGEIGHPEVNPQKINLAKLACKFPELTFDESTGELKGICQPTSFGDGNILKGLMRDKIRVGFSTRATGSVRPGKFLNEDALIVNKGCRIIQLDAVSNPSINRFPDEVVVKEEAEVPSTKKIFIMSGRELIKSLF
jgi:hypothetical protein